MGHNKSRRMVGGTTTPRLPPAVARASRRRGLGNIENIGGESMGEEAGNTNPPIRLMYDENTVAAAAGPGYVGVPAAAPGFTGLVAPEHFPPTSPFFPAAAASVPMPRGLPSPRIRGRHRIYPNVNVAGAAAAVRLFDPSPAGTPYVPLDGGPASPEGHERLVPRALFHPGRMEEEEMGGGGRKRKITKRKGAKREGFRGRKMVGGTTTPIIPPFPQPSSPPPRTQALPPPRYAVAPPERTLESVMADIPVMTPSPGGNGEMDRFYRAQGRLAQLEEDDRRAAQVPVDAAFDSPMHPSPPVVGRVAPPVFEAPPASPFPAFRGFASPSSGLGAPPASPFPAFRGFASPSSGLGSLPASARAPERETSRSRVPESPFTRSGALFGDEMGGGRRRRRATKKRGDIRRRFHGQRGGWPLSCTGSKCTAAVAPAPLTPEQMNYIQYKPGGVGRGWKCPICEVISPVLEYTDRYVRGSRANNEDGYYAHTCPACQNEIPGMEENIRIQEGQAAVQRLVSEEQVTAAAEDLRRQARELGVSEENIENNIRRITQPNTRSIDDFLGNTIGGARRRGTKKRGTKRKVLRRTLHRLRGGWPSWLRNPFSGCMDGKCDAAVAPAPPEEPQAEIFLIRFNNQTYDIIQRLIELLQRSEVELKNIQITLISLCNTINNIFIICAQNRNNQLFKEFFARSKNIVSNLRFILQLLGLYESGRGISTNVERDVVDDENVMLISEEMRDAINISLLREVILGGERMTLLSYIKNSSENTKLNEIPEIIQRIMRVLIIMGFGPRTTSSRPASPPREAWGSDI